MIDSLKELLAELQNLITTTKNRGNKVQKIIIRSLTDREELRTALKQFIENSRFNNNRAELAEQLSKIYPFENWSERKLNYILSDATNIDSSQLNQILDFIEPDEKIEFSFVTLQEALDKCRVLMSNLESDLYNSRATENKIDDKEFSLITSRANLIISNINKFLTNTQRLVGQTLL